VRTKAQTKRKNLRIDTKRASQNFSDNSCSIASTLKGTCPVGTQKSARESSDCPQELAYRRSKARFFLIDTQKCAYESSNLRKYLRTDVQRQWSIRYAQENQFSNKPNSWTTKRGWTAEIKLTEGEASNTTLPQGAQRSN
jgi:hypothetical protein